MALSSTAFLLRLLPASGPHLGKRLVDLFFRQQPAGQDAMFERGVFVMSHGQSGPLASKQMFRSACRMGLALPNCFSRPGIVGRRKTNTM